MESFTTDTFLQLASPERLTPLTRHSSLVAGTISRRELSLPGESIWIILSTSLTLLYSRIVSYRTTDAPLNNSKVTITEGTFEQLPTLWNVAKGLASLKLGDVREVALTVTMGVNNIKENRRIEF